MWGPDSYNSMDTELRAAGSLGVEGPGRCSGSEDENTRAGWLAGQAVSHVWFGSLDHLPGTHFRSFLLSFALRQEDAGSEFLSLAGGGFGPHLTQLHAEGGVTSLQGHSGPAGNPVLLVCRGWHKASHGS